MTEIGGATGEQYASRFSQQPLRPAPVEASWFVVQTRPRHEKKLASELEAKGMAVFLPLFSALHQWSDRSRRVEMPLFANYVFVQLVARCDSRASVLRCAGVVGFVGAGGVGVSVPAGEIEAIHRLLREKIPFTHCPFLNVGQRVRIRGGSLDGIQGILTMNSHRSLVVSVEGIQRSIEVRIDGYRVDAV